MGSGLVEEQRRLVPADVMRAADAEADGDRLAHGDVGGAVADTLTRGTLPRSAA